MSSINELEKINQLYDVYGALLTDKQKEYFELYYFEDLSLQEIAEQYGVSRNAIHTNIKSSLALLKNYEENLHMIESKNRLLDRIQRYEEDLKVDLYDLKEMIG